jgi:hypothetical protein
VEAREEAQTYRNALAPERFHVGVTGSAEGLDDDASVVGAPFVEKTFRLRDWLTGSFSLYGYLSTKDLGNELNVPGTYSPFPDFTSDTADIGPFNIFQNWTSSVAIGTDRLYFQSGLVRSSVGPFFDNGVVVGKQAGKAGHFSANYTGEKWSLEILWLELVASTAWGMGRYPDKHLRAHVLTFRPVPALELAFFESVVWGGRFEPLYLIPFAETFAAGALADNKDNSFMGLYAKWNFAKNAQFASQIYIDDIHFNDLVRFKFNTKYKLAGEAGVVWAPEKSFLKSLSADYTAVFPYMYTHMRSLEPDTGDTRYPSQLGYTGEPNYQDYSHIGRSLGADLEPNSDRISVRAALRSFYNIDISFLGYFTRHGNASENRIADGLMDGEYHDGSIFDDGNNDGEWDADGDGTADSGEGSNYDNNYRYLNFLTQSVLETKLACGFGVSWRIPIPKKFGSLSLNAEYVGEYGWNRNLIRDNDSFRSYWSVGGSYRY